LYRNIEIVAGWGDCEDDMLEEHAGALGLVRIIWRLHKKVIADLVVQHEADQVTRRNRYLHPFYIPVELELIEDLPGSMDYGGSLPYNVQTARKVLDELKFHRNVERVQVSVSARDLVSFVLDNQIRDYLLVKPPDNPYKTKSSCMFL
jgi:hypothetical protein